MVTGPGTSPVVAAKRYLHGKVGIDSEAGPTEIMVIADETADRPCGGFGQPGGTRPVASVLVTDSVQLADEVNALLSGQVERLDNIERIRTALTGTQSGIVLVDGLEQMIAVADAYGAEHLEVQTRDPAQVAGRIRNAGAIFVGPWSPVPLGDYSAGSTHVLPTAGVARFSSGLTARSFQKTVHVITYDESSLSQIGDTVKTFAHAERLPGHAAAISVRETGDAR